VILAHAGAKKVKPLLNVRDPRLLARECQAPFRKKLFHKRLDFLFEEVFGTACDDESSSAGESHPHALTDPDVNLAAHPAPIVQPQAVPPSANAQRGAAAVGQSARANGWLGAGGLSASCISAWPSGPESGP